MPSEHVRVLLIEDDGNYIRLIRDRLSQETASIFDLECVETLESGLRQLTTTGPDVVLLDLFLPDSEGLDTFLKIHAQAPATPVVVLTVYDDDAIALEAVRRGAQDYLVKGLITDARMLGRVIQYAIERQRMQSALQNLALIDELTKLYNRRGFLKLATQHLKLARRAKRGSLLVLVDLDGLKQINDSFGHREGDQALIDTAELLRGAFRASDIIARIGGDEFAILAIEAHKESGQLLATRVQEKLREYNTRKFQSFTLALSEGVTYFDSERALSLEELMAQADHALYEQKRTKQNASPG